GPSPCAPSLVVRVNVMPPTTTLVVARTTVVPATAEVIVTVHEPVPPLVKQSGLPTKLPGPLWMVWWMSVPSGAGTNPPPRPALIITVDVSTWLVPVGLVAVGGLMWMFAAPNVFTPSPPFVPPP